MKRFIATLTLTCALFSVAFAGDMPTCGMPAPGETHTPPGETQSPPEGGNTQGTGLALLFLDLLF